MAVAADSRMDKAKAKAHELAAANGLPYQVYEQESGKLVVMVAKPGTEEGGPVHYVAYPEATIDDDSPQATPEQAYAEGAVAQGAGQKMVDCPYPQTSTLHDPWMRGYAEAKLNAAPAEAPKPAKAAKGAAAAAPTKPARKVTGAEAKVEDQEEITRAAAATKQQRCAGCRLPFPVKLLDADGLCKVCVAKEAAGEPLQASAAAAVAQDGNGEMTEDEVAAMFNPQAADDDDDEEIEVVTEAPPAPKGKAALKAVPSPKASPKAAAVKAAPPATKAAAKNGTAKPSPKATEEGTSAVIGSKAAAAKIKSPESVPGFHMQRVSRATKLPQSIYEADVKGSPFDAKLGAWVITCPHTVAYFASKSKAYVEFRTPQAWCSDCAKVAAQQ